MATIVDIDDTLLRNGTQPIQRTIEYIKTLKGPIYIVTGRSPKQRTETVRALRAAGVRYSALYMNPGPMSDNEYKGEMGKKLKARGVTLAIENNPDARAAYNRAGLETKDPAKLPDMSKFWIL
jgi:hydroxymethylpyrimidine pyrophosphatase-like HAD family hydrolase